MSVKIVVDSAIDLPNEVINELDIEVVPLTVSFGQDHYLDRLEMNSDQFYERMGLEKELPKTAQPAPGRFLEVFERLAKAGHEIICLCVSSHLSGTYNSARIAQSMTDAKVEIIDTLSASVGLGLLSYLAATSAKAGKSIQDIVTEIKQRADNLTVLALLDTLENIVKGGRMSPLNGAIANILNLKIIVEVKNGKVIPIDKIRGTQKALARMKQVMVERIGNNDLSLIGLADAINKKSAEKLKEDLQNVFQKATFISTSVGATIGAYAGKGALVLSF